MAKGSKVSLLSFFLDFYDEDDLIRSFKETDLDRIKKKNKVPLNFPEQDGWVRAYAPFSFQVIMDVIFNCIGNVITLTKTDELGIIYHHNSVETGFYKLSLVSDVFYKLPTDTFELLLTETDEPKVLPNYERKWHNTTNDEKVEQICGKISDMFYLSRCTKEKNHYLPSRNHVKLALIFFGSPANRGKWEEFYYSLFPSTSLITSNEEDSFFKKRRLAIIFEPEFGDLALTYGISEKKIVYIDGCPCNLALIPRYIKESRESETITSLYNLSRAFTDKFIGVPAHYKRFSRVVSMLCHLELFGQSCNEKEVALKTEELRHGMACEDSIYKLRKHSPWNLHHETSLVSDSTRRRSDFETVVDPRGGRVHISPFDSIKWQEDSLCMLRGYAFVDQFYCRDFSSTLLTADRKAYTFLAFAYAFLSQMLTTSTFCYNDLKYKNNRPLLESYEWWITYDGLLYYKRETDERKKITEDGKYRVAPLYKRENGEKGEEKEELEKKQNTLVDKDIDEEKPFFLRESGTDEKRKRYTNANRNRKMDPNLFPDAENDNNTTTASGEVDTLIGTNLTLDFDPFKLRKYDGIGRFPSTVGEEELQQKMKNGEIMYRFDEMDKNGLPFVLKSFRWAVSDPTLAKTQGIDEHNFSVDSFQSVVETCAFYFAVCECDMKSTTKELTISCPSITRTSESVAEILLLPGEKLMSNRWLWMSNPLWVQTCLYVISKEKRNCVIMRTAPNVPEKFDDICFSATFVGQWKHSHTILLGYVSEDLSSFSYDIFWCSMTFQDTTFVAKKTKIWKVERLDEKKPLKSRRDNEDEGIKLEEISTPEFDELLKRSILFVINDELS